jgi:hypothetical protein
MAALAYAPCFKRDLRRDTGARNIEFSHAFWKPGSLEELVSGSRRERIWPSSVSQDSAAAAYDRRPADCVLQ